jgi:hypothetical protein
MWLQSRTNFLLVITIGGCLFTGPPRARAQGDLTGRSLGGYGATLAETMSRSGGSSLIPYAGGFGGFMPYRMAGGGALAFRPRPNSTMDPVRSSFSLSSMSGGMGSGSRSFLTSRARGGMGSLTGGMGLSLGMRPQATRPGGMSVMPPSFGYPFRQPPSLGSSSGGMSISMP